jgi:hypothetical protein
MKKIYALGMMAALVVALGACNKKEEAPKPQPTPAPAPTTTSAPGVSVLAVTVGNAIGADKKVAQAANSFAKKDTIYASVDTTGSGSATLKAKWTYRADGKVAVVKEDSQTINPTGPSSSEFHVSKPDGWPAGDYQVEIFADDKPAGSKSFTVK